MRPTFAISLFFLLLPLGAVAQDEVSPPPSVGIYPDTAADYGVGTDLGVDTDYVGESLRGTTPGGSIPGGAIGYTTPGIEPSRTLRHGLGGYSSSLPAPLPHAPFEFVMPDRALFISYDMFRRQSGLTVPEYGTTAPRMLRPGGGGYMPLVVRHNSVLSLSGSREIFPSMGFSNSVAVGYAWAPSDRVTFYGNLYASDNMYHLSRFRNFGVSGRMRVQVAERVFLNGYGAYALPGGEGSRQLPPGMYPASSFGGTIEVKITDKFGIEGGVMREYNPFTRSWRTNYVASPVIY
jgi:hypothetical protein